MRKWTTLLLFTGICAAQAIPARPKPEDYPVQARVPTFTLAGEFQAHTLPTGKTALFAADFLKQLITKFLKRKDLIGLQK